MMPASMATQDVVNNVAPGLAICPRPNSRHDTINAAAGPKARHTRRKTTPRTITSSNTLDSIASPAPRQADAGP